MRPISYSETAAGFLARSFVASRGATQLLFGGMFGFIGQPSAD
jgi:hypothetical protein